MNAHVAFWMMGWFSWVIMGAAAWKRHDAPAEAATAVCGMFALGCAWRAAMCWVTP